MPNYEGINDILGNLSTTTRVQDDNIYTTDSNAWQPWYVDTNNFNKDYGKVFSGVDIVSFFSPSSILPSSTADVLAFAEAKAYQSDESGSPPEKIYDNTDDGTGGDSIPLATYETVGSGADQDRIAVFGTTMWSDFDYGDSDAQDPLMFENLLDLMNEETVKAAGEIVIDLPDNDPPQLEILFPRDLATVTGLVPVAAEAKDPFGIASIEFYFDGELVSNSLYYGFDSSKVSEGPHEVRIVVTDTSGNTAEAIHVYRVDHDFKPTLRSTAKFMTYNIKESGIFPEWFSVVKEENPDVLLLVESGNFDDDNDFLLNKVVTELNTYFIDEAPYSAYTLQGIDNAWNGITLISRFEFESPQKLDSLKSDTGSTVNIPLPFLATTLKVGSTDVSLIGGHLTCCPSGKIPRANEQEAIINFMDDLGDIPIVYLGDMNSESPEDTDANGPNDLGTEPIEMLINASHPKASKVHTFTDVFRSLNPDDPGVSYLPFGSRIDYIFTNQYFSGKLLNSTTGDTRSASEGSDHASVDAYIDLGEWTPDVVVDRFIPDVTLTPEIQSSTSSLSSEAAGLPFSVTPLVFGLAVIVLLKKRK